VSTDTVSQNPRTTTLLELLQGLSLAASPQEVLGLMATHYSRLRPNDYMISLSCRGLAPGEYRITRRLSPPAVIAGRAAVPPALTPTTGAALPIHRGGLLGRFIERPWPTVLGDLRCTDDPVLGDDLAPFRSVMALPLFHEGQALYWNIQFRLEPDAYSERDLEQGWIVANLVGGANTRLLLMNEIRSLNGKLGHEFEEVARVQRSLLPQSTPEISGLRIASSYLTSQQAGGDYYYHRVLDDGRLGFVIADVAGHGAAAATVMAMLHGILHSYEGRADQPHEILAYANNYFARSGISGSFTTAFLGMIEPDSGRLTYSSAGHHPPRLRRRCSGRIEHLDQAGGLPLGVLEHFDADSSQTVLSPGDTLLLYTDGVIEARSPSGDEFGVENLDLAFIAARDGPDAAVERINQALHRHTGRLDRDDDQTLLLLQRSEPGAPAARGSP
jgi:phosphoserine phosphatase RsbU/P